MPLRKAHGITVLTSHPSLPFLHCFASQFSLLFSHKLTWAGRWTGLVSDSDSLEIMFWSHGDEVLLERHLQILISLVWKGVGDECEEGGKEVEYQKGVRKSGMWEGIVWEWSVWSVREECEGVGCECGVWECGVWESGVRVCTNPSSLSHNSFYLTCEEGVECGNKTNWH